MNHHHASVVYMFINSNGGLCKVGEIREDLLLDFSNTLIENHIPDSDQSMDVNIKAKKLSLFEGASDVIEVVFELRNLMIFHYQVLKAVSIAAGPLRMTSRVLTDPKAAIMPETTLGIMAEDEVFGTMDTLLQILLVVNRAIVAKSPIMFRNYEGVVNDHV